MEALSCFNSVDLQKLEIFVCVSELGNLSKAAVALDTLPSIVSRHLAALEQSCDVFFYEMAGRMQLRAAEVGDLSMEPQRVHDEYGTGDATVVFESGLGDDWQPWQLVAPEVAEQARVFAMRAREMLPKTEPGWRRAWVARLNSACSLRPRGSGIASAMESDNALATRLPRRFRSRANHRSVSLSINGSAR